MKTSLTINYNLCITEKEFLEDPELEDDVPVSYLSHKELYEHGIKKATLVAKKLRELQEQGRTSVDNYT